MMVYARRVKKMRSNGAIKEKFVMEKDSVFLILCDMKRQSGL